MDLDHRADLPRVSYAQNGEDILLDRVFENHVGTYMDVGACYPTIHNNTYFFYQRGWRGVNLEPLPWLRQLFDEKRPEDLNLSVAAGEFEGEMPFYEVPSSGGLSTLSKQIAEEYRAQGLEVIERRVPVRTIAALIEEYAIAPPDFLSIDAEGTETHVIRGIPLTHWRPRVLVVESTWPQTTIPSHEEWEPILLAKGYLFAAFNGVNRFYLREDLREQLSCFERPVSALDQYVLADLVNLQEQVESFREQSIQWEIDRNLWREHFALFDRQREEFNAQRAEFVRGYAEFERAYAEADAAYKRFADELSTRQERERELANLLAVREQQLATSQQELATSRQELAITQQELADCRRLQVACQQELTELQSLLRPYQLIDRLGVVTASYSFAQRLKKMRAV
jgi:FkbM family methyltransferase